MTSYRPHLRVSSAESVTEGHPDKVADFISDSVLDAFLEIDPRSRVDCDTLCKSGTVVLAGEITSEATGVDLEAVVRQAIREGGYADPDEEFSADGVRVEILLTPQAPEIAGGVGSREAAAETLGAGDQSVVVGYATDETAELMPLPILLAHRLTASLARHRKEGRAPWLGPDGKALVSVAYRGDDVGPIENVLVAAQHARHAPLESVRAYVREELVPEALGERAPAPDRIFVNTAGTFHRGGPAVDAGLTGRKSVMDAYGPGVPHGGGGLSGKDPTKVDRSGAYFARHAARLVVRSGLAKRVEIAVAYAIGRAEPLALSVETFGTGNPRDAAAFLDGLDFRPGKMIETLGLFAPIYRRSTNYGHFGRSGLPWEH